MTRARPLMPSLRPDVCRSMLASLCVAGALVATPASAADVAFVEASSELDGGRPATNAYNAIDGKDSTVWCARKDDASPALSFGFDRNVTVTHLEVVLAPPKGDGMDRARKRPRSVMVADVEHRVEARFKDDAGPQVLELSPPAKGKRIVVEIPEAFAGDAPDAPLCVAEVVLKHRDQAMTGASVATKLRALNTASKRLLHEWLDDPSAPTKTLLFNVDGTFEYRFEPLLEGKPARVRGKWSATERTLSLDVGGKTYKLRSRLTKVDEGDGRTVELTIGGEPPHPSMASTFKPAPSRLP